MKIANLSVYFVLATAMLSSSLIAAEIGSAPGASAVATIDSESGVKEVDKPLKVNGQNRNLSMMMVLKGDKDSIQFLNIRQNFKNEILDTSF